MDRRRPRTSNPAAEDELAAVKAAAWAWHQRGSGNEGKPVRKLDLARSPRAQYRPSRYRLEALRAAAPGPSPLPPPGGTGRVESSNSLLDVYEIDRITREIDRLVATSCGHGGSRAGRRRGGEESEVGKRAARRRVSGFWVRHAVGICGARGDVVEAVVGRPRRGMPVEVAPFGFGTL